MGIAGGLFVGGVITATNFLLSGLPYAQLSTATDGYQVLPGGLIMQWGITTHGAEGSQSVTFPVPFPNTILSAQATLVIPSFNAAYNQWAQVSSPVRTGMDVIAQYHEGSPTWPVNIYWFAIGC